MAPWALYPELYFPMKFQGNGKALCHQSSSLPGLASGILTDHEGDPMGACLDVERHAAGQEVSGHRGQFAYDARQEGGRGLQSGVILTAGRKEENLSSA